MTTTTLHRFVCIPDVPAYLACGWSPCATLDGTHHGEWSVHLRWLCQCPAREPSWAPALQGAMGRSPSEQTRPEVLPGADAEASVRFSEGLEAAHSIQTDAA